MATLCLLLHIQFLIFEKFIPTHNYKVDSWHYDLSSK